MQYSVISFLAFFTASGMACDINIHGLPATVMGLVCKELKQHQGADEDAFADTICQETGKFRLLCDAEVKKCWDYIVGTCPEHIPEEEEFVRGGVLKLNWKDCTGAPTRGKVTDDAHALTLGEKTTATGSGTTDQVVSGGTFLMDVRALFVGQMFSGDICTAKTFTLPLGVGSLTWKGMKCPFERGSATVATTITLSGSLSASFARARIQVTATTLGSNELLCMESDTAPETEQQILV